MDCWRENLRCQSILARQEFHTSLDIGSRKEGFSRKINPLYDCEKSNTATKLHQNISTYFEMFRKLRLLQTHTFECILRASYEMSFTESRAPKAQTKKAGCFYCLPAIKNGQSVQNSQKVSQLCELLNEGVYFESRLQRGKNNLLSKCSILMGLSIYKALVQYDRHSVRCSPSKVRNSRFTKEVRSFKCTFFQKLDVQTHLN